MAEMARLKLAFEDNTMAVTEPYPRYLAEGALADFGFTVDGEPTKPIPWIDGRIVRYALLAPVID